MKIKNVILIGLLAFGIQQANAISIPTEYTNGINVEYKEDSLDFVSDSILTRGAVYVYENNNPKIVNFQYHSDTNTLKIKVENGDWDYINRYTDDTSLNYAIGSLIALKLVEKHIIPIGSELDKFYKW